MPLCLSGEAAPAHPGACEAGPNEEEQGGVCAGAAPGSPLGRSGLVVAAIADAPLPGPWESMTRRLPSLAVESDLRLLKVPLGLVVVFPRGKVVKASPGSRRGSSGNTKQLSLGLCVRGDESLLEEEVVRV